MAKRDETLEMAALYEEGGLTLQQIADRYGVSKQTVSQRFSKIKVVRPPRPPAYPPKCALIGKARLEHLYATEKLSIDAISRVLGTNSHVVYRALEFYEILKRRSIKSIGKYIDTIRGLNPGERMEIDCPSRHPHATLHKSAGDAGFKISVKKLGNGRFAVTRIN